MSRYNQNLRVPIARICKSVGYENIQTSSLAVAEDILHNFLTKFCQNLHGITEHCNRTEPTLRDLLFCFKEQHINIQGLLDFVKATDPVPCAVTVPVPIMLLESPLLIDISGDDEYILD